MAFQRGSTSGRRSAIPPAGGGVTPRAASGVVRKESANLSRMACWANNANRINMAFVQVRGLGHYSEHAVDGCWQSPAYKPAHPPYVQSGARSRREHPAVGPARAEKSDRAQPSQLR